MGLTFEWLWGIFALMKAILIGQSIDIHHHGFAGSASETLSFKGCSGDKYRTEFSLDIRRNGADKALLEKIQVDWDFDIEITITAKPKEIKPVVIKL